MGSSSKRRQTFSKMTRERTVKERRERKQEKKDAKRAAAAAGETTETETEVEAPPADDVPA